jgi:hypothetical protein
MNFLVQNQHTNIIIIPALHRHDLVMSSCISNEIQTFNRELSKMTKAMSHVVILDVSLDRKDFTQHGKRLNSTGKEKVAIFIGQRLTNLLNKQVNNILSLTWVDDSNDTNLLKKKEGTETFVNDARVSGRSEKLPVTRSNEFYGIPREK